MTDLFEYAMRDEQRRSGGDTELIRAFFKFHNENPQVYELFNRFTHQVIDRGFEHYSADAVMHRVRWHTGVETAGGDGFKINNNLIAYYSRLWMKHNPRWVGFFRTRDVHGSIESAA